MSKKYYWDPETGDYAEVIEKNKYHVMKDGDPMELTEKEYESYIEEQLRNAQEKDKAYEPYCRSREYFLDQAKTIVCNDRENQYGSPENNFLFIAQLWTAYLGERLTKYLEESDVAIMMALLKIARISTGSFKADSWIDAIGYLACGAELDSAERGESSE